MINITIPGLICVSTVRVWLVCRGRYAVGRRNMYLILVLGLLPVLVAARRIIYIKVVIVVNHSPIHNVLINNTTLQHVTLAITSLDHARHAPTYVHYSQHYRIYAA